MEPIPGRPVERDDHVTIADVARRAGVGIGTVSRVLNGHRSVSPSTRAKVSSAMEAMRYQPNAAARSLSRRDGSAIAVIVPFFTRASMSARLGGLQRGLVELDRDLVLIGVEDAAQLPRQLARVPRRVDAAAVVIVSIQPEPADLERMLAAQIPLVALDVDIPGVASIVSDNVRGGRAATEHLLGLGHRRIAYLGDRPVPGLGFTSSRDRRLGYQEALANAGVPIDSGLIAEGPFGEESASQLALDLLTAGRPTAVVCHSDTEALGVLRAARELGLRVPDDLSIIGCDDVEVASWAGLTTMRQALVASGQLAGDLVRHALTAGSIDPRQRYPFHHELVVRDTTASVHVPSST